MVILSTFYGNDEITDQNIGMADADTIVVYKTVRHICKNTNVRIITDLSKENIFYITKLTQS